MRLYLHITYIIHIFAYIIEVYQTSNIMKATRQSEKQVVTVFPGATGPKSLMALWSREEVINSAHLGIISIHLN